MNEQFPPSENNAEKTPIKEGVAEVFKQNPELAEIGTQEQYSEYLDSIFPESLYKQIFLHGSPTTEKFEVEDWNLHHHKETATNLGVGYYFATTKDIAERYSNYGKGRLHYTMLNIQRPIYTDIIKNDNAGLLAYVRNTPTSEMAGEGNDAILNIQDADRENFSPYNKYLLAYSGPVDQKGFPARQEFHMRIPTITQLAVVDKSQIHILGSNSDIEKFKEFVV